MFFCATIQEFIRSIEGNSLITTLIGGGVVVTLFAYIKDIFKFLQKLVLNLISFEVVERFNMEYNSPLQFQKLMYLIKSKSKTLWMKEIEVSKVNDTGDSDQRYSVIPHGHSYHLLYGKLISITKEYDTHGVKIVTNVTIRVFFCTKKKFSKLFLNDMKIIEPKESQDSVNVNVLGEYTYTSEKPKRSIDTIYNPDGVPQMLLNDIRTFIESEKLYKDLDIPYKRNYLLYGLPGTGKTSCVLALASEINWNIMSIDINKNRIDDIIRICTGCRNTIFLFEDIDAVTKDLNSRKKTRTDDSKLFDVMQKGEVTLSQLLNLTDGLVTPYKSVSIFTTNHIEVLDDAFLRDGRMDVKVEFKNLDWNTTLRMIEDKTDIRPLDDDPNIVFRNSIKPAELQENILKYNLKKISKEDFLEKFRQR